MPLTKKDQGNADGGDSKTKKVAQKDGHDDNADDVEDYKEKYQKSEIARQKLRDTLALVKERALNTKQLLEQHQELKTKLSEEERARKKAESNENKMKKSSEGLQKRVSNLEDEIKKLQAMVHTMLQHQSSSGIGGDGIGRAINISHNKRIDVVKEIDALRVQVSKHDAQLAMWTKAMKEVTERPIIPKRDHTTLTKNKDKVDTVRRNEDPIRTKAVAALKRTQEQQSPQKNRHIDGPPLTMENEDEDDTLGLQQLEPSPTPQKKQRKTITNPLKIGGLHDVHSPGSAETQEIVLFSDTITAALEKMKSAKATKDDDMTMIIASTVQELESAFQSATLTTDTPSLKNSRKRTLDPVVVCQLYNNLLISSFTSSILRCASPIPFKRFSTISPRHWFGGRTSGGAGSTATRNRSNTRVGGGSGGSLPTSYMGVWCRDEVITHNSLHTLIQCAIQLSDCASMRTKTHKPKFSGEKAAVVEVGTLSFADQLAHELAVLVLTNLAIPSCDHTITQIKQSRLESSCTECCTAITVAVALWRVRGNAKQFQTFLIDMIVAALGREKDSNDNALNCRFKLLPTLASAIDVWPEAVPVKGAVGNSLHAVMQHLVHPSQTANTHLTQRTETLLAVQWLREASCLLKWAAWSTVAQQDGDGESTMGRLHDLLDQFSVVDRNRV